MFLPSSKTVKISLQLSVEDGEGEAASYFCFQHNLKADQGRPHTSSFLCSPRVQLAYFIKPNRWLSLLNDKGIQGCEEVAGMGEVRASTRGRICFSNQPEFITATFLFRLLDTVSPREMISLSQSRLPHKSEMKRRARWKFGKMD